MLEASGHIVELTVRLRELEALLRESRSRENKLLKDLEEMKRRHREAKQGLSQLKGANPVSSPKAPWLIFHCLLVSPSILPSVVVVEELRQHWTQSSTQREEIIRLKQELQLLHRDLLLSGTRAATPQTPERRSLTNCFPLCHQERETPGKMSCWNWLAPNRTAPCRSCAACNRCALSPSRPPRPPSDSAEACFLIPPARGVGELRHLSGPAA